MGKEKINKTLKQLKWLFGNWKAIEGFMKIPNEDPIPYYEEFKFEPDPLQAQVNYTSKSWNAETKEPIHSERGFVLIKPKTSNIAFAVAHSHGLVTLEEGCVSDEGLEVASVGIVNVGGTDKPDTKGIKRQYKLCDDKLEIIVYVSKSDDPTFLYEHVRAIYEKL